MLAPVAYATFADAIPESKNRERALRTVRHRGSAAYDALKSSVCKELLRELYEQYPTVKEHCDERGGPAFFELGTPLTNNFYLGATRGEVS